MGGLSTRSPGSHWTAVLLFVAQFGDLLLQLGLQSEDSSLAQLPFSPPARIDLHFSQTGAFVPESGQDLAGLL